MWRMVEEKTRISTRWQKPRSKLQVRAFACGLFFPITYINLWKKSQVLSFTLASRVSSIEIVFDIGVAHPTPSFSLPPTAPGRTALSRLSFRFSLSNLFYVGHGSKISSKTRLVLGYVVGEQGAKCSATVWTVVALCFEVVAGEAVHSATALADRAFVECLI